MIVTVEPGAERDVTPWRGALVFVRSGAIVLEGHGGSRARFGRGSMLALDPGVLRALHNDGDEPAVLVAVRCTPWTPSVR